MEAKGVYQRGGLVGRKELSRVEGRAHGIGNPSMMHPTIRCPSKFEGGAGGGGGGGKETAFGMKTFTYHPHITTPAPHPRPHGHPVCHPLLSRPENVA